MDHPFRNAAFGGFNRQDVLTYLEHTAKENEEAQQLLHKRLEEAQQLVSTQDTQLGEQSEQINTLTEENKTLRAQLEELEQSVAASRTQAEKTDEELIRVREELEQAKGKIAALQPDAAAYAAVKERTAGVELEAHGRAKAIQEQAEQEARQLRRQMERWMQKVEREYDSLRSEVESTVSHAADQLMKAGKHLEQVNIFLGEQDVALEALAQAYADAEPERVAAPMPIPEE